MIAKGKYMCWAPNRDSKRHCIGILACSLELCDTSAPCYVRIDGALPIILGSRLSFVTGMIYIFGFAESVVSMNEALVTQQVLNTLAHNTESRSDCISLGIRGKRESVEALTKRQGRIWERIQRRITKWFDKVSRDEKFLEEEGVCGKGPGYWFVPNIDNKFALGTEEDRTYMTDETGIQITPENERLVLGFPIHDVGEAMDLLNPYFQASIPEAFLTIHNSRFTESVTDVLKNSKQLFSLGFCFFVRNTKIKDQVIPYMTGPRSLELDDHELEQTDTATVLSIIYEEGNIRLWQGFSELDVGFVATIGNNVIWRTQGRKITPLFVYGRDLDIVKNRFLELVRKSRVIPAKVRGNIVVEVNKAERVLLGSQDALPELQE